MSTKNRICVRGKNRNRRRTRRFLEAQTLDGTKGKRHTIAYAYDRSNRLVKVTDSTGAALLYTYDQYGNRNSEKVRISDDTYKETSV